MRQRDNDEEGRREPPHSSPQPPRDSGKTGQPRPARRFSMLDRLRGHGRQERGDSRR